MQRNFPELKLDAKIQDILIRHRYKQDITTDDAVKEIMELVAQ